MALVKKIVLFIITLFFIIILLIGATRAHENDLTLQCKLTKLYDKDRDFKMDVNFESIMTIKYDYEKAGELVNIFDDTKLLGRQFKGEVSGKYIKANYVGKYDANTSILLDRSNGFFMREGFDDNGKSFYEFTGKCKKIPMQF